MASVIAGVAMAEVEVGDKLWRLKLTGMTLKEH